MDSLTVTASAGKIGVDSTDSSAHAVLLTGLFSFND
jgi:hypothetical protein